jgi:hypothetical protein
MPVNEFEKQVQQRMEELKLTPSAEVWMEVEKRIRKEKKRRRILFWWLLPGLLLGGGLLYFNIGEKPAKTAALQQRPIEKIQHPDENKVLSPEAMAPDKPGYNSGQVVDDKTNAENDSKKNSIVPITAIRPGPRANTAVTKPVYTRKMNSKKYPYPMEAKNNPVITDENKTMEPVPAVTVINDRTKTDSTHEAVTITDKLPAPVRDVTAFSKDSSATAATTVPEDSTKTETTNEEKPLTGSATKKKKWNYGAGVQAGSSNTRTGGIFGGGMASYDATPLTTSGGGTYTGPPVYIDAPRRGSSWGLQFFAQKDLSSRLSFRASLQYDYFSSRIRTGNRVDSARQVNNSISDNLTVRSFYGPPGSGGSSRSYTNRYHFAGLSATISWNIIKTKTFSLAWENSVGLSRLLSTNALHYDRNLQVYYGDFEPFRKTQFFLGSGLAIPLLNREKLRVSFHPFVQYAPGDLLKENNGPRSHFVNYGAGLKFLLPRRK